MLCILTLERRVLGLRLRIVWMHVKQLRACMHMQVEMGAFVLTPRAAAQPPMPRNSDKFFRS